MTSAYEHMFARSADGLSGAVGLLRCPVCACGLRATGAALRCEAGHSFDVARQGYVDLMPAGKRPAGDTAEMVAARDAFLQGGHYESIAEAVQDAAAGA